MSNSKLNCHRSIFELSETGLEMAEYRRESEGSRKECVWMDVILI
jgi:hypothetical protein